MNMMGDSLSWKVSFLFLVNKIDFFSTWLTLPLNILANNNMLMSSLSVYICISKLDELPEMLPASPCNIQRSLQRVNQPEVEVANESAGRLLPFSHGKFLSYFLVFFPFNLAVSVPRDSFTLESLWFSTIHSVVCSLLILQIFSVLFFFCVCILNPQVIVTLPLSCLSTFLESFDQRPTIRKK